MNGPGAFCHRSPEIRACFQHFLCIEAQWRSTAVEIQTFVRRNYDGSTRVLSKRSMEVLNWFKNLLLRTVWGLSSAEDLMDQAALSGEDRSRLPHRRVP
jgi:hypothetical protein